jgi:hypothetical protein
MFNWFRKKETQAERIRRELKEFNEDHLPLTYLPELDVPLQHTPPLGLDVNLPYLLGSVIPKQRMKLQAEEKRLHSRLAIVERDMRQLDELEAVTKKAP